MHINKKAVMLKMAMLQINQSQLAKLSGISRQTLSAVINGKSCRPDLLGKIAKGLEVDVTEIIEQ